MNNDVEIKQGERIDDLHRNGYLLCQFTMKITMKL